MSRVLFGFLTYFAGLKTWLRNGSLLRISIVPFILDLLCLLGGLYYTATHVSSVTSRFISRESHFLLYSFVFLVTALSLFFVVIFAVFIFANIIAFPFNDLLAEKTLSIHAPGGASPGASQGTGSWMSQKVGRRVGKSLRNTVAMLEKIAVLAGAGSLLALGTLLIPGFGILAAGAGIFLMACDRMDYAFDQYRLSFRERVAFLRRNLPEVLGFSGALGLTTAIPLVNILLMPGGVVCGACLVARLTPQSRMDTAAALGTDLA